jgi:SnoaL-like polyketide cyclase
MDIEELIAAGDTVVLRATFRGTETGGYVGRAPTGRAVHEWVVTIMHFAKPTRSSGSGPVPTNSVCLSSSESWTTPGPARQIAKRRVNHE